MPSVLAIHRSGVDARSWDSLRAALGEELELVAPDRLGWGSSEAPLQYERTTIDEQAERAARSLPPGEVILCGAGIGAVVALDLLTRDPAPVVGAVLIEPPLLAFLPEATEALSADAETLREAIAAGGRRALIEACLSGALPALAPGAERVGEPFAEPLRSDETPFLAELGAVTGWPIPAGALGATDVPVAIVVSDTTGELVRDACTRLAELIPTASVVEADIAAGLPEVAAAEQLAVALRALFSSGGA